MSKNLTKYFHKNMDHQAGLDHSTHRTKIVATVGPACDTYDKLLDLVRAGVNVFRLNFSHGSHEDKALIIDHIRKINSTEPYNISILGDLQGPKLRVGEIENNALPVVIGDILTFTQAALEFFQTVVICILAWGNANDTFKSALKMKRADVKRRAHLVGL